jgi:heat shock protein beta
MSFVPYFSPETAESKEENEDEDSDKGEAEEEKPKTKAVKETTYEWELLNDVKAIWLRSPKEVTEEEYTKFYNSLAKVKYCHHYLCDTSQEL